MSTRREEPSGSSASPPSALYSCGRCASGKHSADMVRSEAVRHAAMCHNAIVRKTHLLALPMRGR